MGDRDSMDLEADPLFAGLALNTVNFTGLT